MPASEALLDEESIKRFRSRYRETFGATATGDPLYEAISDGRRMSGHGALAAAVRGAADDPVRSSRRERPDRARRRRRPGARRAPRVDRRLLRQPPQDDVGRSRQLSPARAERALSDRSRNGTRRSPTARSTSPRSSPSPRASGSSASASSRRAISLPSARSRPTSTKPSPTMSASYGRAATRSCSPATASARASAFPACSTTTASSRRSWSTAGRRRSAARPQPALMVLPLDHGFTAPDVAVLTEQDMLGDRLVRRRKKRKGAAAFLSELATLTPGDLVVHDDHGIGRYEGLTSIKVGKAPHDCVALEYAGGNKLYVPVENIDLLTRYGSESEGVALDRLGGEGWQRRKSRMKERIREIAGELIKTAAMRATRPGVVIEPDSAYPAVRRPLPLRGDGRPGPRDRGSARRPRSRASRWTGWSAATSASARRRSRFAPRSSRPCRACRSRSSPDDPARPPALPQFHRAARGLPDPRRPAVAAGARGRGEEDQEGLENGQVDIVIGTHAILGERHQVQEAWGSSSSTRSSISE